MSGDRLLVPISDSRTVRRTVGAAVDRVLSEATTDAPALIVFAYVHSPETDGRPELEADADSLLSRAEVWAEEDAGDRADMLRTETTALGQDQYLFSPEEVAGVLCDAGEEWDVDLIFLDPEYDPGIGAPLIRSFATEIEREERFDVEIAAVRTATRRGPLGGGTSLAQFGAVFGVSLVFYHVLAGGISAFDAVTGVMSAALVAVAFTRVSLHRDPDLVETPKRFLRGLLYVPYLLKEIVVSNVVVAAVVLDPRKSVDPEMTRIRPSVYGSLPVTTLSNSITLTPGTLTVRVDGRTLLVHTLIPSAREDLFDGGLERAVRFLFYGRRAARIDPMIDRGDAAVVDGDAGAIEDAASRGEARTAAADDTAISDDTATPDDDAAISDDESQTDDSRDGGEGS